MSGNPYEIEPVKFVASDRSVIGVMEAELDDIAYILDQFIIAQRRALQSNDSADGITAWALLSDLAFRLDESNDERLDSLRALLAKAYDLAEAKRKPNKSWSGCFPAHLLREFEAQRPPGRTPTEIERIEALESQIAILTDLTCNLQSQCKQHEYFIEQLLKLDSSETSA